MSVSSATTAASIGCASRSVTQPPATAAAPRLGLPARERRRPDARRHQDVLCDLGRAARGVHPAPRAGSVLVRRQLPGVARRCAAPRRAAAAPSYRPRELGRPERPEPGDDLLAALEGAHAAGRETPAGSHHLDLDLDLPALRRAQVVQRERPQPALAGRVDPGQQRAHEDRGDVAPIGSDRRRPARIDRGAEAPLLERFDGGRELEGGRHGRGDYPRRGLRRPAACRASPVAAAAAGSAAQPPPRLRPARGRARARRSAAHRRGSRGS